jgi:hypothetical protein
MSTSTETVVRELDRRINDGFDVRLLWHSQTNCVLVAVEGRHGDTLEFEVAPAEALEAFYHPFAYAADCASRPVQLDRCPAAGADRREQLLP